MTSLHSPHSPLFPEQRKDRPRVIKGERFSACPWFLARLKIEGKLAGKAGSAGTLSITCISCKANKKHEINVCTK